jgi:ribonuclease G
MLNEFQLESDINKGGKITNVLSANQWVLVQIAKEPISTKGPRITSELSLAGRFVVLVPFYNHVSISQKIKSAEERLLDPPVGCHWLQNRLVMAACA